VVKRKARAAGGPYVRRGALCGAVNSPRRPASASIQLVLHQALNQTRVAQHPSAEFRLCIEDVKPHAFVLDRENAEHTRLKRLDVGSIVDGAVSAKTRSTRFPSLKRPAMYTMATSWSSNVAGCTKAIGVTFPAVALAVAHLQTRRARSEEHANR
jgi:hypothetical protein